MVHPSGASHNKRCLCFFLVSQSLLIKSKAQLWRAQVAYLPIRVVFVLQLHKTNVNRYYGLAQIAQEETFAIQM